MNTNLPLADLWYASYLELQRAKDLELKNRSALVKQLPASDKHFCLVDGTKFAMTIPISWSVSDDENRNLVDVEDSIEAHGELSPIKWKPTLDVKAYKELPENVRAMLHSYVTSKPGAPQISALKGKFEIES